MAGNTSIFSGISTFYYPNRGAIFTLIILFYAKKHFLSVIILSCLMIANTGCSKDDDDNPAPKTKTELITTGTWKFRMQRSMVYL